MCLKADWKVIYKIGKWIVFIYIFFLSFYFFILKFYDIWWCKYLYLVMYQFHSWVVIIKTIFITINKTFILRLSDINFILNFSRSTHPINQPLLCFIHFINIFCCFSFIFFILFSYVSSMPLLCLKIQQKWDNLQNIYLPLGLTEMLRNFLIQWIWKFSRL